MAARMAKRAGSPTHDSAPAKRPPRSVVRVDADDDSAATTVAGRHPLGVAPRGNMILASGDGAAADSTRADGLGAMRVLDDSFLVDFLKTYCPVSALGRLAQCSRALRAFCASDEVWKSLTLERYGDSFVPFEGSWRATFANRLHGTRGAVFALARVGPDEQRRPLYSDYLFQEYFMATVPLEPWAARERHVVRISARDLSVAQFRERFDWRNEPVVITDAFTHWPAFCGEWSPERLVARFPDTAFACGLADMRLADYFAYAAAAVEEVPLYLFDKAFGERAPELLADYTVPDYFAEDFFSLLPPALRPAFRWWLVGPPRSGSPFHKDPNYTSAWNALVSGRKKWILMPPNLVPPQVLPSDDGWDVTGPISLVNWYADVYAETLDEPYLSQVVEVIQQPGDLLFIPAQWWHSALNIEPSIAVTQNVVTRGNLPEVLNFLRRKGDDEDERVYEPLKAAVEAHAPTALAEIRAWRAANRFNARERFPMPRDKSGAAPPSLWQRIEDAGAQPNTAQPNTAQPNTAAAPAAVSAPAARFEFAFDFGASASPVE